MDLQDKIVENEVSKELSTSSGVLDSTVEVAGQTIQATEEADALDLEIVNLKKSLSSSRNICIIVWVLCLIVLVARLFMG